MNGEGKPVYLRDIWPTRAEIQAVEQEFVVPAMFNDVYSRISVSRRLYSQLQTDTQHAHSINGEE